MNDLLSPGVKPVEKMPDLNTGTTVPVGGDVLSATNEKTGLLIEQLARLKGEGNASIQLDLSNKETGKISEVEGYIEKLPDGGLIFLESGRHSGDALRLNDDQVQIDRIKSLDQVNERTKKFDYLGTTREETDFTRHMHISCYERPLDLQNGYQLPESMIGQAVAITFLPDGDRDHPGNRITVVGQIEGFDRTEGEEKITLKSFRTDRKDPITLKKEYHEIKEVAPATIGVSYEAGESVIAVYKSATVKSAADDIANWCKGRYGKGSELEIQTSTGEKISGTLKEFSYGHRGFPAMVLETQNGIEALYMDEIKTIVPRNMHDLQDRTYKGKATDVDPYFKAQK